MIRSALYRSVSVLLGAILISSCSDGAFRAPTAPMDAIAAQNAGAAAKGPEHGGVASDFGNLELKALWWKKKHNSGVSVSRQIGPDGGTIELPANGLTIVFPAGALKDTKTITVTPDDKYVAYKMEPSGTTFDKDVTVTQLLSFTEVAGVPLRAQLYAAYIRDDNAKLGGKVTVSKTDLQLSHTVLSTLTGLPEAEVWVIRHFSRYMLSSG
ncbi:MAG: hypothetical protein ACREMS_08390 [Gemmatimonadaceae bacterium]